MYRECWPDRRRPLLDRQLGPAFLAFIERWRSDLLYPVSPQGMQSRFFPYFWEPYLMMSLTDTDPAAAAVVDAMTYRQHDLSHILQAARNLGADFPRAIAMALKTAPVQKLDWRVEWPEAVLEYPDPAEVLI